MKATLNELVEDWKTGKSKIRESHEIESDTKQALFTKAYANYERPLRYCSGYWVQFSDPNLDEEYKLWKQTGLTVSLYYGNGTVD